MITTGDTQSTLRLVQIADGLGSLPEDDQDIVDALDVAQWEPTGCYFCEFQHEGACDSGTVCWGTSDEYEPKFCTKHFFSPHTGYEFVGTVRQVGLLASDLS
jgi:hypothetical protein